MNNEPNQKPANELTDKELEGVVGGCGDVSYKLDAIAIAGAMITIADGKKIVLNCE